MGVDGEADDVVGVEVGEEDEIDARERLAPAHREQALGRVESANAASTGTRINGDGVFMGQSRREIVESSKNNPKRRIDMRLSCVLVVLGIASLVQAAEPAAKSGTVSGSLSVGGKEIKLASAAAFRDTGDDKRHVVIVLSDKEVPASSWKTGSDMSAWRREHSFQGIAFWIDESNEVYRCEYYDGTPFPTSVSGIFDFKVERAAGGLSGSVKSNAGAARLRTPVKIDATFKAAVK